MANERITRSRARRVSKATFIPRIEFISDATSQPHNSAERVSGRASSAQTRASSGTDSASISGDSNGSAGLSALNIDGANDESPPRRSQRLSERAVSRPDQSGQTSSGAGEGADSDSQSSTSDDDDNAQAPRAPSARQRTRTVPAPGVGDIADWGTDPGRRGRTGEGVGMCVLANRHVPRVLSAQGMLDSIHPDYVTGYPLLFLMAHLNTDTDTAAYAAIGEAAVAQRHTAPSNDVLRQRKREAIKLLAHESNVTPAQALTAFTRACAAAETTPGDINANNPTATTNTQSQPTGIIPANTAGARSRDSDCESSDDKDADDDQDIGGESGDEIDEGYEAERQAPRGALGTGDDDPYPSIEDDAMPSLEDDAMPSLGGATNIEDTSRPTQATQSSADDNELGPDTLDLPAVPIFPSHTAWELQTEQERLETARFYDQPIEPDHLPPSPNAERLRRARTPVFDGGSRATTPSAGTGFFDDTGLGFGDNLRKLEAIVEDEGEGDDAEVAEEDLDAMQF